MDPVEASRSANYTEVENGDELCVDELYSVQSSGIVLFHVFVILYQVGTAIKNRESGIHKIRNRSTKKHTDHSFL